MKSFFILSLATLIATTPVYASVPYCKGTQVSENEDMAIQTIVAKFAARMKCDVGNNCLLKWTDKDNTTKFSVAWHQQCGPVINGIYQLGDEGHGSTFVCDYSDGNKVCCWPLGYDYFKDFVICK